MAKWDELIVEAYTGHPNIRKKIRKFKELQNELEKIQKIIGAVYADSRMAHRRISQVSEELSDLAGEIKEGIEDNVDDPDEHLEHIYNAQHYADAAEALLDVLQDKATEAESLADKADRETSEADEQFLADAKDGTYDPDV